MMKNILTILVMLLFGLNICHAYEITNEEMLKDISIQHIVDFVGYNMLNIVQIKNRMIYTYDKESKKKLLKCNKALTKREIIIYEML